MTVPSIGGQLPHSDVWLRTQHQLQDHHQICDAIVIEFVDDLIRCPANMNARTSPISSSTLSSYTTVLLFWTGSTSANNVLSVIDPCTYYKGYHSIIHITLVETCFRFILLEVGSDNSARGFQVFKSRKP
ncbi:hypothetical protein DPMN_162701 [Dreissena polymorpha]|uniref:Uncharacterized protein n=1 Tax=Dreissena polymorpha TaxID=45954 RepID=A0A9D4EQ21_DREPO|nr:hypothetical protein DPMN_162701 [Dreissena polymorpha]